MFGVIVIQPRFIVSKLGIAELILLLHLLKATSNNYQTHLLLRLITLFTL
jgi:hypothetical protein